MGLFAAKPITSSGEPFTGQHYLKLLIACLSYANLCFLNVWAEIYDRAFDFFRKYAVTWQVIAALTLDILIITALTFAVVYLVLSTGRSVWIRVLKWSMILALIVPLNVIRTDEAFSSMQQVYIGRIIIVAMGVALGIFLMLRWERFSARAATVVLLLVAPSMPLALAKAMMQIVQGPSQGAFPNQPLQPALPQPPGAPHMVWVLFDEWDRILTFDQRPADLALPEVDRFRQQAVQANRVTPPARFTLGSVPSLLTGKNYVETKSQIPSEIQLIYDAAKPPLALSAQETVFTAARRMGFNVGIAGWYLPYCRLIPECTVCSWRAGIGIYGREEFEDPTSVRSMMKQIFTEQVSKIPQLHRLRINLDRPARKALHVISYRQVREDMLRTITDPRLNLVYVHMNVPHMPAIYDRSNDAFSTSMDNSYADNLRLVDRTIRDIRETLEKAGMWDTTSILFTADHPLRVVKEQSQHPEVPYLLKMAGQSRGISYDKPVQELVTKDLLLAILSGRVTTPEQVASWLDSDGSNGRRP
jgi:hypothetical protein